MSLKIREFSLGAINMRILIVALYRLLELFELVVLLRCILSFFAGGGNPFYVFLCKITEPVLRPIRNVLSRTMMGNGMFDFSPVVAILLIGFFERCLVLISRLF